MNVAESGTYRLDAAAANVAAGGKLNVLVDGQLVATVNVQNTGSWSTFAVNQSGPFNLAAGTHVIRLAMLPGASNGAIGNLDWFRFVKL